MMFNEPKLMTIWEFRELFDYQGDYNYPFDDPNIKSESVCMCSVCQHLRLRTMDSNV